ncbi:hypothetical protein BDP81DRAFT_399571 [Colletotrichum phormii]|uniref:Secreted protein n=1 Tax=Colletotrichum phormii TaxID=359342 RepID=A0AAI9ZEU6_9PEZI|nr:uncharacterized protein BDP81DRAFT_399571 [Colletotrichum phormii]KAK1623254.1 hypothetical protein BDP81DRAFT_399571 [Colletotrichum phormii]
MLLFTKANLLACLALVQLCSATAIDVTGLSPRGAYRDDSGSSDCLQVGCDTSVCAKDPVDALAVASKGVSLILGPDCAGWAEGSPSVVQGDKSCPAGTQLYRGDLRVWRAWNNVGKKFTTTFVAWEQFKCATCWGRKDVTCVKGPKQVPDPNTGLCGPWAL